MSQIPNVLTVLRILLILPFAYFLLSFEYTHAFLVFLVAGVSDGIDGFLARRFQWRSRFGEIADPIADKLLLVTSYILLAWLGHTPLWLLALVFGRDIVIVVGGLLYHVRFQRFDIQPTLLGKLSTFTQIFYIVIVLLHLSSYADLAYLLLPGIYAVAAITILSGAHYVYIWANRTRTELRLKK